MNPLWLLAASASMTVSASPSTAPLRCYGWPDGLVEHVAWSPDGRYLAAKLHTLAGQDDVLVIRYPQGDPVVVASDVGFDPFAGVAVDDDGTAYYLRTRNDGPDHISAVPIDPNVPAPAPIPVEGDPNRIRYTGHGLTLIEGFGPDIVVREYASPDATPSLAWDQAALSPDGLTIHPIDVDPSGDHAAVVLQDDTGASSIRVLDRTGVARGWSGAVSPVAIAIDDDGTTVAVEDSRTGTVITVDLLDGTMTTVSPEPALDLAYSHGRLAIAKATPSSESLCVIEARR